MYSDQHSNIKTTKTLLSIPVTRDNIANIIKKLDPSKAHGHDMISILMLKLCGDSVLPPLELIFKTSVTFIDISNAVDKVWHKALLHKLKENGISGKLLNTVKDFLYQWKQRVALNMQLSSWAVTEAGVPQGFILGPLFF